MTDTTDYLPGLEIADPQDFQFSYADPSDAWWRRALIKSVEYFSGQPQLLELYRQWAANPPEGENFFAAAVRLLGLKLDLGSDAFAKVPKEGPVLFIANHPYGVVDGVLMGHFASQIRPDVKIITHSLLCEVPEARPFLLPVDFSGTVEAAKTSARTRNDSVQWLRQGHSVVIFPAGSVSTSNHPFKGAAVDAEWHSFTGRLALLPNVTVVPICFQGENSRLFQMVSHIHYALRIALLFRETRRLMGREIKVAVGEPIGADALAKFGSREAVVQELRRLTLSLRGAHAPDPDETFHWPKHIHVE